jgi:tripartite ATP-independent transporter DctM subunit
MILIILIFLLLSFIGVPIAFSLLFPSIFFLLIKGIDIPLVVLVQRMTRGLDSFILIAIPLFIFAGLLSNELGISEKIFDFCLEYVGHIKGGLAHVNVLGSMIFAGMSGSAQADAAGLGSVEMEAMKREGYDVDFSAAVTAASSTIGPVIPPSLCMIIYCFVVRGVSLARLFLAGVIPGIIMGVSMMALIYIMAIMGKIKGNIRKKVEWRQRIKNIPKYIPVLLAPLFLEGGMLIGFATPTELGAVTVVYIFLLGIIYRTLNIKTLLKCLGNTAISIGVLVFIISCAFTFGYVITLVKIPDLLANFIFAIASTREGILAVIIIILIVLGCFLESTIIELIMFPIFASIAKSVGVDLVHFGMIAVMCVMMGTLTPPFGICLYIVSHFSKRSIWAVSKALIPFYVLFIFFLIILMYFPSVSLFFPNLLLGKS